MCRQTSQTIAPLWCITDAVNRAADQTSPPKSVALSAAGIPLGTPTALAKIRCEKTRWSAGRLGKNFEKAVNEASDLARPLISRLKEAARTFIEFVDERNELVHAHVYSEPDWTQQLVYQGKDKTRTWPLAQIDDLTHRFENSSIALRDLMKEIWNISPLIWRNDGSCPYLATILITLLLAAPSMSLLCAPLGDTIFKEILAKTDNYIASVFTIYTNIIDMFA
jgi:hypothetical protein